MNKKIIALFCVVVLIASIFVACGKTKLYTQEINGVERPVVTNEAGEFVTDKDGDIAVYATENGKIVTNANGEEVINHVDAPDAIVNPNGVISKEFFKYPLIDGWKADDNGRMYKKGTDSKCYIDFAYTGLATMETPFRAMMDKIANQNNQIIKKINDGEYKEKGFAKAEQVNEVIEFKDYSAYHFAYTVYDEDGSVVHHAENIYFVVNSEVVYQIDYACVDGVGYDKDFNFLEWAQNNVKINIKLLNSTVKEIIEGAIEAK